MSTFEIPHDLESAPPESTPLAAGALPAPPVRVEHPRKSLPGRIGSLPWGLIVSLVVIVVALVAAVDPALFTNSSPYTISYGAYLQAPSIHHLFGTDQIGRDIYTRVVYGSRATLTAALLALVISFFVGAPLGLIAGSVGGWVDAAIMRLADLLMSIPNMILALAIVAALGFGTVHVAIAVGVAGVAAVTRLMRATTLIVVKSPYVEAAELGGLPRAQILLRHVLPNALSPVAAYVALDFGQSIIYIASLSFLGLGVKPPAPEWGSLTANGIEYLSTAWWITTTPGLVIAIVVVAANGVFLHFQRTSSSVA